MTPKDPSQSGPSPRDEDEARLARRLDQLDGALKKVEPEVKPATPVSRDMAGFAQAMRLGSEFVAGVLVGLGLGLGLDTVAGSSPWGLIVLTLAGFLAGVVNMMRVVGALPASRFGKPDDHQKR